MTLDRMDRIHIVGVGGAGMSALATILVQRGYKVSGSDLKGSAATERLLALGVDVTIGHLPENVGDAKVLAYSTAVRESNSELSAARTAGIKVIDRAELLRELCVDRRVIAISGTHGKTTTTSMMSLALVGAGLDPTFVVGGELNEVGTGAHSGGSDYMVVEADESDGTHLKIPAYLAVLTNVEPDHLDHYGSVAGLEHAFSTFVERSVLPAVVCVDDVGAERVSRDMPRVSYGFSARADYRIIDLELLQDGTRFTVRFEGDDVAKVLLAIPGRHNALNATAVIAATQSLGVPISPVVGALGRYTGVARRFQLKGEALSATFYDDYAHLPSEIGVTLQSARQVGAGRRVVAIFQPHRYSRTKELASELGESLGGCDFAIVTDVYSAGEAPIPGISGAAVAASARAILGQDRVLYVPYRSDLGNEVAKVIRRGDLVLTLGAGDITNLFWELPEETSGT